ncbi:FAD-binding oxidoreductase [Saccharopolyspora shandongensis]|uniref:NAD(P)/FAD-dependent oxidoreductase n=1 Tax=Saccharopolyspora shandongensis TaxID=418495 RepID=UPI0034046426
MSVSRLRSGAEPSLSPGPRYFREGVPVLGIARDLTGQWAVATGAGPVIADRVVISAGLWTKGLLRGLGVDGSMEAGKGYSITSPGCGVAPRHAMKLIESNIACTPFEGGLRISGGFELGPVDGEPRARPLRRIVRHAARYLQDWRPGRNQLLLAGFRPATPDSLPIIGPVPGAGGVFTSSGHGTLGLTLAPATADALVPAVLHGTTQTGLAPFSVRRFARSRR